MHTDVHHYMQYYRQIEFILVLQTYNLIHIIVRINFTLLSIYVAYDDALSIQQMKYALI